MINNSGGLNMRKLAYSFSKDTLIKKGGKNNED